MEKIFPGQKAPDFILEDQDGNSVTLKQFVGKKVVLYFYPKDDTPGCTAEACNFRDNYQELQNQDIILLGVSVDDIKSHRKFADKYDLPFPLLSDESHEVVKAYGVWAEKNMYGKKFMGINRTTFVIDEKGNIIVVIDKVDTKKATDQILKLLK